tara:strand:+ start:216 stop:677 length:462 start_codon:yes stop_codon:yes gene_type:complete
MAFTAATVQALFDSMASHAGASGLFERVNTHEPKRAPKGLVAALWVDSIGPAQSSGLAATTARVVFNLRIYKDMISEPQDAIDPAILAAAAALMEDYSGDFTLGGTVRAIDLLGMTGVPLSAQAGYINADQRMLRVMTITIPLIINDAWTQAA